MDFLGDFGVVTGLEAMFEGGFDSAVFAGVDGQAYAILRA